MTTETLPNPLNPDILTPRSTAHYDVLMDGPKVERVNDLDVSGEFKREEAGTVMSALKEMADEIAGTELSFDFKDEHYRHSSYRFLIYSASTGDFNTNEINAAGVSMEFGGPTNRTTEKNILAGFSPDIVTNIIKQPPGFSDESIDQIDSLADATEMPVADSSLGSVHISCMNRFNEPGAIGSPIREKAIDESARALKDGGFLVWDGGFLGDYDRMIQNGLVPTYMEFRLAIAKPSEDTYAGTAISFNGVFQKQHER